MNNKSLIGIIVGLMIATSIIYFVETVEEFEEEEMVEGTFFLIVGVAYLLVAYLMLTKKSNLPYVVTIMGTIGIMTLYGITRTDMAIAFGMEAENIGHLGIVSKTLQVGIVLGSVITLIKYRK